ncbi:MAG: hypothetical protein HGA85_08410 [Nanoarchaeota archaeon]|nr:hypothetical protein [Nanoarchaeota archaeon]
MIDPLQLAVGMLAALFLPGFLIVMLLFSEMKLLEKLLMSVIFSIIIDIIIGVYFGYDEAQAAATGGLNYTNLAYAELTIVSCLLAMLLIKLAIVKAKTFLFKDKVQKKNGNK